MEPSPGKAWVAPPDVLELEALVRSEAERLGLRVVDAREKHILALVLTWPSTPVRSAWLWCQGEGGRVFLYTRDRDGHNQDGRSLPIRRACLAHDMRVVWRYLKWGRR